MLEIKELSKTYRPKKGVPVEALKGITLSFEEKGLVFVLGKSGSGKSTLLNLIGGLDFADKGEIIIDGKSSKDFKTADYDAYRNTYIGFVFQEYNILNEYTVGENIMLALELQNKKADKNLLDKILKEVDLEGYAERKPNELSGGQKQRVAIARALIKQPQILMADEPTGALDSNTGKAILDTLKKISEEKLVIVVSHDREFAQKYGDRVIELADGEVISDENKTEDIQEKEKSEGEASKGKFVKSRLPYRHALRMGASSIKSKPIRLAVTILLCFLTFALFGVVDVVNSFSPRKILYDAYANGEYSQLAFTAIKPDADGGDYDLNGISQEDLVFLNSKTSNNFIGATYFKKKGAISIDDFISKYLLNGSNYSEYYSACLHGFFPASEEFFTEQGFELIGRIPTNDNEIVLPQYILDQINIAGIKLYIETKEPPVKKQSVDVIPDKNRTAKDLLTTEYFIKLEDAFFKIVGIVNTKVDPQGKFEELKPSTITTPKNNKKDLLTQECVDYFKYGYHSLGYVNSQYYEEIVKSHKFDMSTWDSFGRVMEGDIEFSYSKGAFSIVASDKDLDKTADVIWLDGNERTLLQDNEIVVGLDFGAKLLSTDYDNSLIYKHYKKSYFDGIVSINDMNFSDLVKKGNWLAYFDEAEKIEIEKLQPFKDYVMSNGTWMLELMYSRMLGFNFFEVNRDLLVYDINNLTESLWRFLYAEYLHVHLDYYNIGTPSNPILLEMKGGYENNFLGLRTGKLIENIDVPKLYIQGKVALGNVDIINTNNINFDVKDIDVYNLLTDTYDYWSIVGIYIPRDDYPEFKDRDIIIFNNLLYAKAEELQEIIYNFAVAPTPTDKEELYSLIDIHLTEGQSRSLRINNGASFITNLVNTVMRTIRLIMILAGIGVALFAVLLMSNYIATSITNRKRDIGILRALGAKTSDVFAIFVNESIIMAVINSILSIFVALGASIGINKFMQAKYMADFTILSFGIRQVAIILCLSIAVAVIASLIPIYRLSKKKPIDCIQDR